MPNFTKKALLTAGAVIALSTGLPGGQAWATVLPGACTGSVLNFPTGNSTGSIPLSAITGTNCVQAQDKLFGGFVNGATDPIPASGTVTFSLNVIAGQDVHTFGIQDSFVTGNTYTFSFEVFETTGPHITALRGDFSQSSGGPSTLTKTSVPPGTG
jgi:hypothetical protein